MEIKDFQKVDTSDLPQCFMIWFKNVKFFQKEKLKVYKKIKTSIKQDDIFKIKLTTEINNYTISVNISRNYLGCTVQRKEANLGENWLRGMDLPDGELNVNTFNDIMAAIVFYEAKKIDYEKFKLFDLIEDLKKGHIITREKWQFRTYLYYNYEKLPKICTENRKPYHWIPNLEELEARDWINTQFFYTGSQSITQVINHYVP